jgi:hypothetical protein
VGTLNLGHINSNDYMRRNIHGPLRPVWLRIESVALGSDLRFVDRLGIVFQVKFIGTGSGRCHGNDQGGSHGKSLHVCKWQGSGKDG